MADEKVRNSVWNLRVATAVIKGANFFDDLKACIHEVKILHSEPIQTTNADVKCVIPQDLKELLGRVLSYYRQLHANIVRTA